MTTQVSDVVTEARRILRDTRASAQRYTDDDYIAAINMGQEAMVSANPDTNVVHRVLALQAGAKQTLPEDCVEFKFGTRNMGTDGLIPGMSIVPVTRAEMDAAEADWYNAEADEEVIHTIASAEDDAFYVYPPQPATPTQIEVQMVALPDDVAATTDTISVHDKYRFALANFCAHYLLDQDSEHDKSGQRAQTYLQKFMGLIGVTGGDDG